MSRYVAKKWLLDGPKYYETYKGEVEFLPRMADSRGKRPKANKAEVVAYLRDAAIKSYAVGPGRDYFEPSVLTRINGVTDGVYSWNSSLAHYVERYDVYLPPAFEAHMKAKKYRLPKKLDTRMFMYASNDPPTADDLATFAAELDAAGRADEAEATYLHVLDAAPAHERSLKAMTRRYLSQERLEEVIAMVGAAIPHAPANPELWFVHGTATAARAEQLATQRSGVDSAARTQHAIEDLKRAASLGHAGAAKMLRKSFGVEPPKPAASGTKDDLIAQIKAAAAADAPLIGRGK